MAVGIYVDGWHLLLQAYQFEESLHGTDSFSRLGQAQPRDRMSGDWLAEHAIALVRDVLNQISKKFADDLSIPGAVAEPALVRMVMEDDQTCDPKALLIVRPQFALQVFRAKNPEDAARGRLQQEKGYLKKKGRSTARVDASLKYLDDGILILNVWSKEKREYVNEPRNLKQVDGFFAALKEKCERLHRSGQPPETAESLREPRVDVTEYGIKSIKEKGVDTSLVIAVMDDVCRRRFDKYCLLTNDSDFAPLVEHLDRQGEDIHVINLVGDLSAGAFRFLPKDRIVVPDLLSDPKAFAAYAEFAAKDIALAQSMDNEWEFISADMDRAFGLPPDELE